jgi:hypothetical protein
MLAPVSTTGRANDIARTAQPIKPTTGTASPYSSPSRGHAKRGEIGDAIVDQNHERRSRGNGPKAAHGRNDGGDGTNEQRA